MGLAHSLGQEACTLARLSILLGRIFPPKTRSTAAYPVREDPARLCLYSLPHLSRLASQRVPGFSKSCG